MLSKACQLLLFVVFCMAACQRPSQPSPLMDNYDLSSIDRPNWQLATLKNIDGHVVEEGHFYKGQKNGTWTYYDVDGKNIEKLVSYIDGETHGPSITLNPQGQLQERAHYKNNRLDGLVEQYQYGKLKMSAQYKDGLLDGKVTKYINFSNKLLSEAEYKAGKLHGIFKQFDDEGNTIMQYQYRNGEKIEGGAVNQ